MRACDQGYAGLEKFVSLMNLPKPMTCNNYDKIINKLIVATKGVAETKIYDACGRSTERIQPVLWIQQFRVMDPGNDAIFIPKQGSINNNDKKESRYVSFSQLKLGVYDAWANFNIGRKASKLIYIWET